MNIAMIAVGFVLLGYLAWAARTWAGAAAATRLGQAQARRVGIALDPAVAGPVVSRLADRVLVGAVGGVLGGVGIAVWLLDAGRDAGVGWSLVWCAVGVLLGRSVFLAGLALIEARRAVAGPGPRVARMNRPRMGDYVTTGERGLAVAMGVLPIVLVVVWSAGPGSGAEVGFPAAIFAVVPVVGLVAGVLLARRITSRPQPATSPRALAWDDALRARTLRDVNSAVTLLGVSYCLLTTSVMGVIPLPTLPPSAALTHAVAAIFLGCGVVAAGCALTPSPGSRFKRRLWAHDRSLVGAMPAELRPR